MEQCHQHQLPAGAQAPVHDPQRLGRALGAVTWNALYKQAWVSPANTFRRLIEFFNDGTNLIETYHSDVPN